MNGKRAKIIKYSAKNLLGSIGVSPEEGVGQYRQAMNCHSVEPIIIDNKIMRDPDGQTLMKPKLNPGTVHSEDKHRLFYQFLKRLYKNDRYAYDQALTHVAVELRKEYHKKQAKELAKVMEA